MGSLGEAVLDLTADPSKLDAGLAQGKSKVTGTLDGLKGAFGGATGTMLGVLSAGAMQQIGQGIISAGKDIIGATMEAQNAQTQLEAVLKSTGGAAGVTKEQVNALAEKYSELTMYEDDTIVSGENMLLTFTNIGKDVFPDATQAILDMSQAMGQDLQSTAIQVGKALNDPVLGATALRRVGVQLTDDQQKLIKTLVESGDTMGAQKIILAELRKEFGGSAEAAGTTFAGQLKILDNEFKKVKEEAGTAFIPVLKDLVGIAKELMPYLRQAVQWFASLPAPVKLGVIAVLGLVAVLTPLIGVISAVIGLVSALAPVFAAIGAVLTGPVGIAILAIIALVALLYAAWQSNFFGIRDTVSAAWQAIQLIFAAFKAAFSGDWYTFGQLIRQAWDVIWNLIEQRIQGAWNTIKNVAMNIVNGVKAAFTINWSELGTNIINGILNGLRNGIKAVADMARNVARAALNAAKGFLGINSPSMAFAELGQFSGIGFSQGLQKTLTPQSVQGTLGRVMAGAQQTISRSVTNNVTVNNPVPERASASVDSTLRKMSYLGIVK